MKILHRGKEIQIDKDELWRLKKYKYYYSCTGYNTYLFRTQRINKKNYTIRLHREIMNCPKKLQVDHINGNTLDNRKCNLRVCTNAQNVWNTGIMKTNKSGYKGVYWSKEKKKWHSQITSYGKRIHIGYFNNKIDAHKAYCRASKIYHKVFGRTA